MRLLHFVQVLVLLWSTAGAQSTKPPVATLKAQLRVQQSDNARLQGYIAIAQYYFDVDQYDSLYTYTKEGLRLVNKSRDYSGDLHYFLARYYRQRGLYSQAITFTRQAIEYAQTANAVKKIVEFQYTLAVIYSDAGDLSRAIDQIGRNIRYLATHEDIPTLAANYLLIIALYRELKNPSLEKAYTQKYFALDKRNWPAVDRMYASILEGEILEQKGQFKKAEVAYQESLRYARLTNSPFRVIDALEVVGINLRNQQRYKLAIQLFDAQFRKARALKSRAVMASAKRELAMTYLASQRPKDALPEARYALYLFRQNKQPDGIINSLGTLTAVLKANGQYQEALEIYEEQQHLKENTYSERNAQKLAYMQAVFDIETKEKTIKLLQKNAQINLLKTLRQQQQLTLARQTQLAAAAIIGLLLTLIGTVYFFLRKSQRAYSALTHQQALLQQTANELTEANAVKNKLFSLIGHDLRSPLASVKVTIRQIQENGDSFQAARLLVDRLERQVDNMLGLLTNLLDWSMIQLNGFHTFSESLLLYPLIDEILSLASEQLQQKQLTVINHVDKTHSAMVDKQQLGVVVHNILTNAIKFTHPGGYIRIQSIGYEDVVELQIRDTGIGMSVEQIAALSTWPEVRKGTMGESGIGLGLRICREMLARQGGRLSIESKLNKGTLVRIQLLTLRNELKPEMA
ncbi:hypothetical protein GCM10028808_45570 [Spirosoma migulaei]